MQDLQHSEGARLARRGHRGGRVHESTPVPPPASAASDDGSVTGGFSTLDLRDRVVIMLLFDQIVTEEQVAQVWDLWRQEYQGDLKTPLWRLLTLVPEIDPELILAEAARVHGIEEARIVPRLAVPMIVDLAFDLPGDEWERMIHLRVVPIGESLQVHSHIKRTIFASHDPTHPDVSSVLSRVTEGSYELRYAPEVAVVGLIAEAFPGPHDGLYRILREERERYEGAADDEEATGQPAVDEAEDTPSDDVPNTSSIVTFFEEMLVQAVRNGATGICMAPRNEQITEILFQVDGRLAPWRLLDHIPSSALYYTVQSVVIRDDFSSEASDRQVIKRWIDGLPIRFRLSTMPAGTNLDREALLIRVLRAAGG